MPAWLFPSYFAFIFPDSSSVESATQHCGGEVENNAQTDAPPVGREFS